MNSSNNEILQIENLILSGQYSKGMELNEEYRSRTDISALDLVKSNILRIRLLNEQELYESSLKSAKKVYQDSLAKSQIIFALNSLIQQIIALIGLKRYEEALKNIKLCDKHILSLNQDQNIEINKRQGILQRLSGEIFLENLEIDKAREVIKRSITLFENIGDKFELSKSFHFLGIFYFYKSDYTRSLECFEKNLTFYQQLNNKPYIIKTLEVLASLHGSISHSKSLIYARQYLSLSQEIGEKNNIGRALNSLSWNYFSSGLINDAEEPARQSLSIFEEIQNKDGYFDSIHLMGDICHFRGDLEHALDYYKQCEPFFMKQGNPRLAFTLTNLGIVNRQQGDLTNAWDYYQQALALSRNSGYVNASLPYVLSYIGEFYYQKGELQKALETLEESVAICEKKKTPIFMSFPLFWLVSISVDTGNLNQANIFLEKLRLLTDQTDNLFVGQCYRVSNAIVMKSSLRFRDRVKAEELLKLVIKETTAWQFVRTIALTHLTETLFYEFYLTQDVEVLDEIKFYVKVSLELALKHSMFIVLVDIYILQGKLALLELNIEKSEQLLNKAQSIVSEKGLSMLESKIFNEKTKFQEQIEQWQKMDKLNAPMKDRLDFAKIEVQVIQMAKRKLEVSEEETIQYIQNAQSIMSEMKKEFKTKRK